jgi:argininosuccinate synthase
MDRADLRSERVGLLVSGGLSCVAVAAYLAASDIDLTCYVADIGQPGDLTPARVTEWLGEHGLPVRQVDLRELMALTCVDLVRYQASYEGGYWNTTGASREVLVAGLAGALRADGCTVLAHGCVGGGNDQLRFSRYTAELAPDLRVFAPWTSGWMLEKFPDRASMAGYLAPLGYPAEITGLAGYSIDGNLGGCSHENLALESVRTWPMDHLRPLMSNWPHQAAGKAETFEVQFAQGRPVAINGEHVSAVEAVLAANAAGGRAGIPPRAVIENRTNGTKCRGVYEAPGLDLLGRCLEFIYQANLEGPAASLHRDLSALLGTAVYQGRSHDQAATAARAAADVLADAATGTVEVELYRGNILGGGLTGLPATPRTPRQTRFATGGHQWHTEDSLSASAS